VGHSRLYSVEFLKFVEFFNKMGIGVFVTFLKPVGAGDALRSDMCGKEDFAYLDKLSKQHNVFWHITHAYGRDIGCIAVKAMVSITAFGDVNLCPYVYKPIGNIFKEPLKDILARGMKTPPWDKYIGTCPVADKDWGPL
jgi:MoaA/NifB/PqqE/SkfB family radical SAM enzyme